FRSPDSFAMRRACPAAAIESDTTEGMRRIENGATKGRRPWPAPVEDAVALYVRHHAGECRAGGHPAGEGARTSKQAENGHGLQTFRRYVQQAPAVQFTAGVVAESSRTFHPANTVQL
ncbi:MAG TPA: hypothetical protein VHF86_05580, partial [Xanthomonadaceae bacterium]|nr:hypothetical protein [Xanthomonadaceae bacterium]